MTTRSCLVSKFGVYDIYRTKCLRPSFTETSTSFFRSY